MTKLIFLFVLLLNSLVSGAEGIHEAQDKGRFYALDGVNLALYGHPLDPKDFGDLSKWRDIVKVPISILAPWGIKKDDSVQAIYFDHNDSQKGLHATVQKYKFGNDVLLRLKQKTEEQQGGAEEKDPSYNHFTVFLGDESYAKKILRESSRNSRLLPHDDYVFGFAYIGEGRIIQAASKETLKLSSVPREDSLYVTLYGFLGRKALDKEVIKGADVMGHKIYIQEVIGEGKEVGCYSYILPKKGNLERFEGGCAVDVYGWIKGAKVIFVNRDAEHPRFNCAALLILSESKVEKVSLPCRPDFFPTDKYSRPLN